VNVKIRHFLCQKLTLLDVYEAVAELNGKICRTMYAICRQVVYDPKIFQINALDKCTQVHKIAYRLAKTYACLIVGSVNEVNKPI
jgi:hypothetical protein